MDFYNLLRSAEELLFELAAMILLYPRTLWRSLRRPLALQHRIDTELGQEGVHRFDDMVSPPVCLLVSVAIGNAVGPQSGDGGTSSALGHWVQQSFYNDLVFTALFFAMTPLIQSWLLLRARGLPFNRVNMRRPFYLQACLVSPIALSLPLALQALDVGAPTWLKIGTGLLALASSGLYLFNNARVVMHQLGVGALRALWMSVLGVAISWLLCLGMLLLLVDPSKAAQA
ncbi:MAG: hypothetical protein LCH70_04835 [Proteobacteria bacterium]|nr:hypothetical protein [Pseudomonadota bacterium]